MFPMKGWLKYHTSVQELSAQHYLELLGYGLESRNKFHQKFFFTSELNMLKTLFQVSTQGSGDDTFRLNVEAPMRAGLSPGFAVGGH